MNAFPSVTYTYTIKIQAKKTSLYLKDLLILKKDGHKKLKIVNFCVNLVTLQDINPMYLALLRRDIGGVVDPTLVRLQWQDTIRNIDV